jgi:hypothetical protein
MKRIREEKMLRDVPEGDWFVYELTGSDYSRFKKDVDSYYSGTELDLIGWHEYEVEDDAVMVSGKFVEDAQKFALSATPKHRELKK